MPRVGNGPGVRLRLQVGDLDAVVRGDYLEDVVRRDRLVVFGQQIFQRFLGQIDAQRIAGQRGERGDTIQITFQFPNVGSDALSDEECHLMGKIDLLLLRLLSQNGHLCLQVRRLDVGDESPLKARAQPLFQRGDLFRRRVRRKDDLLLRLIKRVEGVEELFLRALFSGQELDVVEKQRVDRAVAIAERLHLVVADGRDQFGHERVRRHVDDFPAGTDVSELLSDGLDQMRLAQTCAAVDEQWIERTAQILSDRQRRRVGELIRAPDHEGAEPIPRIEHRRRQLGRRSGRRCSDRNLCIGDELQIQAVGREIVENRTDLHPVPIADGVDESLGRDADVHSLAALRQKTGRREPGYILRPINALLQPIEDLLPNIHEARTV